jgi:hypothetical protein
MPPNYLLELDALPEGHCLGTYHGKRWRCSKSKHAGGRSTKLYAEALDGSDFVSLNLYRTAAGPRLKPCEMPKEKVIDFLEGFEPEG